MGNIDDIFIKSGQYKSTKYNFVNKTYLNLYIIQSECEEKSLFKIYPMDTSIFHWTDSNKPF